LDTQSGDIAEAIHEPVWFWATQDEQGMSTGYFSRTGRDWVGKILFHHPLLGYATVESVGDGAYTITYSPVSLSLADSSDITGEVGGGDGE
jgi:hypothetical protein